MNLRLLPPANEVCTPTPSPGYQTWDLPPPLAIDIWWSSQDTYSNLFT